MLSGHTWVVDIDGQASTASTTAYGKPVITALSGPGAANATTYGGEAVTLTGYNFGPKKGASETGNASFLESVTYGPGGSEYEASRCRVSVAHVEIVCATVAGVGPALAWVVTVDGQASDASSSPKTNYAAPAVRGLSPTRVDTAGGSTHVLNGTDLGMASTDATLQVEPAERTPYPPPPPIHTPISFLIFCFLSLLVLNLIPLSASICVVFRILFLFSFLLSIF
jgi:hypothetical protein